MTLLIIFVKFGKSGVDDTLLNRVLFLLLTIMPDSTKQSVLIIESDEAILKKLSERFNKQDMLVITAKDGYEGYNRACKESPNIIITETLLPSMNGFRISRLLKYDGVEIK